MALAYSTRFAADEAAENTIFLPRKARDTPPWSPHIGGRFPNFRAASTQGALDFFDWAQDRWVVLFNQPKAGGAVSTTEMAALAHAQDDFARRGVRLLGLCDGTIADIQHWQLTISRPFQCRVAFPMISDPALILASAFGMAHWSQGWDQAVRRTLLISPARKVCYLADVPMTLGRSVEEILRIVDAQVLHAQTSLATPVDWQPGDPAIVPNYLPDDRQAELFGDRMVELFPGMRMVPTTVDQTLHD